MLPTVSFSVEIELGWGFHDLDAGFVHLSKGRAAETETLRKLLEVCERWSIPVTFDVVGYLLHESYTPLDGSPHPPGWSPVSEGSDRRTAPLFYAPDLIDMVTRSDVDHEVGTHTYTHAILGRSSRAVIEWELEAVRETHRGFGLPSPRTLVPPRHSLPSVPLGELGVDVIRAPIVTSDVSKPARAMRWLRRTPVVAAPEARESVIVTPCNPDPSLTAPFLRNGRQPPHPAFRLIPRAARARLHRRFLAAGLTAVEERESHIHYWTHLFNMANDDQWPIVRDFLARVGELSAAGCLSVSTMAELA